MLRNDLFICRCSGNLVAVCVLIFDSLLLTVAVAVAGDADAVVAVAVVVVVNATILNGDVSVTFTL